MTSVVDKQSLRSPSSEMNSSGHFTGNIESVNTKIESVEDKTKVILNELNKDRPSLSEDLQDVNKDQLVLVYSQLQKYIDNLQKKYIDEISQLKESEEKLKAQNIEASRRENVLVMRLTMKEHEVHDYAAQLNELKSLIVPTTGALRSTLLDPAVNILIQRMKKELEDTKKKLEDTQNDLNAWKFTPDSNTGKRLMAKCRMLYQENEELGKMITSGRLAKLETDLALQKSLTEEMRKAQAEMDDVVQELDEDIDGMQSTICFWQEQMKKSQSQVMDIDPNGQDQSLDSKTPAGSDQRSPPPNLDDENSQSRTKPEYMYEDSSDRELHVVVDEDEDAQSIDDSKAVDSDRSPVPPVNNSESTPAFPVGNTSSSMDGISDGDDGDL